MRRTPLAFLSAAWPALLVLALQYYWVVGADVSFEEASIALASKRAALLAARSRGQSQVPRDPLFRQPAFPLRPTGLPIVAFCWKSLLQIGGLKSVRTWTTTLFTALLVHHWLGGQKEWLPGFAHSHRSDSPWAIALAMVVVLVRIAPGLAAFTALLLVPANAAGKLRRSLEMADLLLTFPVRGWQIILGELAAPLVIGTAVQWTAVAAFAWTPVEFTGQPIESPFLTLPVLAAGALLFPGLNLINAVLASAAPLLLPAWFKNASAGFEAMGVRLILLLCGLLAFAVALLPAAAAFAAVWFTLHAAGAETAMSAAGALLAASFVLVVEGFCGVYLLGLAFESFDVSEGTA